MGKSKRCTVHGCNSSTEEKNFRSQILTNGVAWCPAHSCQSDKCHCSFSTQLFGHYSFPKSLGLKRVWTSLLNLPDDYQPPAYDGVCSRHFDLSSTSRRAPHRKIPMLNIGRMDVEVQRILSSHVSSTMEKQAVIGMCSPATKSSKAYLADAATSAVFSLERSEKRSENVMAETDLSTLFSGGHESRAANPPNIPMEEDDENNHVVRRRMPPSSNIGPSGEPTIRYRRSHESQSEPMHRTPPQLRRRPLSEIGFRTPTTQEKQPCTQPTPDYASFVGPSVGPVGQTAEACMICEQLVKTVTALRKKNAILQKKIEQIQRKAPPPEPKVITRTEVAFDIDTMPEKRFMALFGTRKKAFALLFEKLEPMARAAVYWKGPKTDSQKYTPTTSRRKSQNVYRQEFLLFLMRIRLKPNVELLAFIFGLSIGQVSIVFTTWLDIFTRQLGWMITLSEPAVCRMLAPPHVAAAFPRLRCIIDCTELFVQKPQSTAAQVATYSQYKKHNTVKVMVAILPNGFVGFLSNSWGGRTSDNYIFKHCGLLDLLQTGDQILADRGFTISDELLRRGVQIAIPPAATGVAQFPLATAMETTRIANVRIHVERTIGRMKTYHILDGVLPITMVRWVDKIFKAVSILVNLQNEIVR